jgi:hypothetical protein
MKKLLFILFLCISSLNIEAQEEIGIKFIGRNQLYRIGIFKNDTVCVLEPAYCWPIKAKNKKELESYWKLVRNVKRVYPYAIIARQRIAEINTELAKIPSSKARKQYIENAEKELFKDFEDDIRTMTFTQGRILIKLIDRETGNTSYALVKEFKGSFSAFFWQGVARIFGSNLKSEYDSKKEDKQIEDIIYRINRGLI